MQVFKLSPLVGDSVNRQVDGRGKREQTQKKRFLRNGITFLPVILERSEESGQRLHDFNVLSCVRTLAPIASQARHFPPRAGEADTKEKRNYTFL